MFSLFRLYLLQVAAYIVFWRYETWMKARAKADKLIHKHRKDHARLCDLIVRAESIIQKESQERLANHEKWRQFDEPLEFA